MISFEEAGAVLDEAADALPGEIFEKLNGGVNLLPATRTDEHGLYILGTYNVDQTGRRVELYYGSFRALYPDATPEKCRRELTHTLKHELTHHLESLAMDRSLEKWDEAHTAQLLAGLADEPLEAESVLFVDEDGAGLAPMAAAFFRLAARDAAPELRAAAAGLSAPPPARVNPKAAKAAALYGVDISGERPRTADLALLDGHDAVLCMTEAQGDALAARFPAFDDRILCLGERDIAPPALDMQGGWNRAADRLAEEIGFLLDELLGEEGEA